MKGVLNVNNEILKEMQNTVNTAVKRQLNMNMSDKSESILREYILDCTKSYTIYSLSVPEGISKRLENTPDEVKGHLLSIGMYIRVFTNDEYYGKVIDHLRKSITKMPHEDDTMEFTNNKEYGDDFVTYSQPNDEAYLTFVDRYPWYLSVVLITLFMGEH